MGRIKEKSESQWLVLSDKDAIKFRENDNSPDMTM